MPVGDGSIPPTPLPTKLSNMKGTGVLDEVWRKNSKARLENEDKIWIANNSTPRSSDNVINLHCSLCSGRLQKIKSTTIEGLAVNLQIPTYRCKVCHSRYIGWNNDLHHENNPELKAEVIIYESPV